MTGGVDVTAALTSAMAAIKEPLRAVNREVRALHEAEAFLDEALVDAAALDDELASLAMAMTAVRTMLERGALTPDEAFRVLEFLSFAGQSAIRLAGELREVRQTATSSRRWS